MQIHIATMFVGTILRERKTIMSDLMLDVGLANELELAFRAARGSDGSEWAAGDVKCLTNPAILGCVLDLIQGRAEIVLKKAKETVVSLLTLVKTITTPAVAGKKTRDCFTNKKRYYYRDNNLDAWFPKEQPEQRESKFSINQLSQSATFKKVMGTFLGQSSNVETLVKLLKERNCCTTLPTIESFIERQEAGEDIGLRINGYANFFFVEDKNESVSVVYARLDGSRWRVDVRGLGRGSVWSADRRFFFCNYTGSL
ncbi:MAG: hypothetical protein A3E02_01560 [Candidatus Zambryskibacteria bacterium RIFCSPHIGHO2_12_FULL_38_34]|uniref:Uncharacterized protein n=1 Tax=Candidatus Zambryskibacteria bacterium RIFCSPLOWO2_12_FULL_39_16 TaxID=1802775 RepID=A0A1G2UTH2_9BACT|nr:MAG: hypothetical protein A3D37_00715 [Candidatus Zambryskibacteria bacterium RIFCSPHIGHO2_02_FULL_38_22]OHA98701.1 MAG: hypothetical protein A3E02_01560 [Candidatus Zambryskibacteria bacterium RIFCSPHIGHO2_12_FULL_38_34]OHB08306.1 MAG: hypothetical protein A3I19_01655 [Candidatus Zambryskibacteria bacterium RIFCSPLOWO2_02_FULL_38_13]OHB12700.1 MAG: hypothetical protein A3G46_00710 [Candidatus Zambryskibacteria bacterium RIFCSPLOWO2_12_FULL_39_16]